MGMLGGKGLKTILNVTFKNLVLLPMPFTFKYIVSIASKWKHHGFFYFKSKVY